MVPGKGYRQAAASMAAHANWRQAEVTKGYARKARECDAAVPGDDTPFTDKLMSYGTEGRVLGGSPPRLRREACPASASGAPRLIN